MPIVKYTQKNVNIETFPDPIVPLVEGDIFDFGDLDGNHAKFFRMLIQHGFITGITPEQYSEFIKLYKKPVDEFAKEDLEKLDEILKSAQINNKIAFQLVGDNVCDRGANDLFFFKILEKLGENKVKYQIVNSNHDMEFIHAQAKVDGKLQATVLGAKHAVSMYNLQNLIDRKIVERSYIDSVFKQYYLPHLVPVSYVPLDNNPDGPIAIYTHAPAGIHAIHAMAKKLEVYDEKLTLRQLIDKINVAYQQKIQAGTLAELYPEAILSKGYYGNYINIDEYPFVYVIWNRNYNLMNNSDSQYYDPRPSDNGNVWKHGHDADGGDQESKFKHVINLDKENPWKTYNKSHRFEETDSYVVYYVTKSPKPELHKNAEIVITHPDKPKKIILDFEKIDLNKTNVDKNHMQTIENKLKKYLLGLANELKKYDIKCSVEEGLIQNNENSSIIASKNLHSLKEKFITIHSLLKHLQNENYTAFTEQFNNKKIQNTIRSHRNSTVTRIVTGIGDVFLLGLRSKVRRDTFSFWRSDGDVLIDEINKLLKDGPGNKFEKNR